MVKKDSCSGWWAVLLLFVVLSIPKPAAAVPNVNGVWNTLPATMPINPVHAALMPNGKVLVIAGSGNCPSSMAGCPGGAPYGFANKSGWALYDPQTKSVAYSTANTPLAWDMFCNGMVLLPDGRPFINGGTLSYDPFHGQSKSAVFDPATNTFTDVQSMANGRWYPTVTTLGDGRVMSFSGLTESGPTNTSVEFYTPGVGWSVPFPAGWTPPLYPRLHLLTNGKVIYSGPTTQSRLYDPSTTTWSNLAVTRYTGTRTYGSSVLLPLLPPYDHPKVMIMGGNNPATATTEIIDMGATAPAWQPGPNMSQARIEMNAVILPNGKVVAMGGSARDEDATTQSLNADIYDPATNVFASGGANAFARLYHSVALLLPDATVLLAGGNPARGSYENHLEVFSPPYLFDSTGALAPRPVISNPPATVFWGSSFTVPTPDASNIASVVLVRNGASTHAFDMDQRLVNLAFTKGGGALTVTAPPNGNVAPPGYYMLFILNAAGVPSQASFVRVSGQPGFSLSTTPSTRAVTITGTTSYTATIGATNGFTGPVNLSVSGLPTGATASFSPTSISGSGSSVMTVTTASTTPAGSYTLTITANGSGITHTATVTLGVTTSTPDFTVSVTPTSQSVSRGRSATYTTSVTRLNGFNGVVSLSVTGLPRRTTANFNPSSVTGTGTSTMTVTTRLFTPTGTYTLRVTGTSGTLSHQTTTTLTVR